MWLNGLCLRGVVLAVLNLHGVLVVVWCALGGWVGGSVGMAALLRPDWSKWGRLGPVEGRNGPVCFDSVAKMRAVRGMSIG